MLRLGLRHPLGCLADLVARRRWFAAGAALACMRIARITGARWSVTAHAWDIWQRPANLPEKLRHADFATTGCEYNARHLREMGDPVHVIVMGVDGERFRRRVPYPDGRTIVAVGRLVEKKGFSDLISAAALMRAAGEPPERVLIAGGGPLMPDLRAQVRELALDDLVELLGPIGHDDVRSLLDSAALLCAPCVVAGDGDRDSMPVIVKEALAMEVSVMATEEVGLPEIVRAGWGRLVPAADPAALAGALRAELALPASERAARGRAGRDFVLASCDAHVEARRLLELMSRP